MKARKFIVKADTLYLTHSGLPRRWGFGDSGSPLSALWCSGTKKRLPAALTDLKRCLPNFLHLRVWCLVQMTQEANSCICRNFAPPSHLLCYFFFLPSTLRNSWCQLKNSERHEPLHPQCQQEGTEKLQRKLVNIQWMPTGRVDAPGQGDLGERCWCNSPAEWSSQSKYRAEEVLLHVRNYSSRGKSNSLISKAHAFLLHPIGIMDLEPSETL